MASEFPDPNDDDLPPEWVVNGWTCECGVFVQGSQRCMVCGQLAPQLRTDPESDDLADLPPEDDYNDSEDQWPEYSDGPPFTGCVDDMV